MASIKVLHITCAVLSITGFTLRGIFLFYSPHLLQNRITKVVPHIVDTVLLLSGIYLVMHWPWAGLQGWLPYKLLALVLYIALGMMAFRFAGFVLQQKLYWLAAVCTVIYLLGVAVVKQPLSWFIYLG
ncbi:MAG: SirB2 family protein [Cellvibrionaceae bacterium]